MISMQQNKQFSVARLVAGDSSSINLFSKLFYRATKYSIPGALT